MFLKFFGVRQDGEYSPKKKQPRPGWTYRYARRNAAHDAHWPSLYRWRLVTRMIRDKMAAWKAGGSKGAVPA